MPKESSWEPWTRSVETLRTELEIPGVAMALLEGEHIQTRGFGVRDAKRGMPVTPQTLFHIASTQKSMTSMFIATLVDDGLFAWDTPVAEITPEFQLRDKEATRTVTMRHLLGMSSGIPASAEDRFDVEEGTAEELFAHVQKVKLRGRPGTRFDYSNVSYALAGYLGTLAAGGSWGQLEKEFGRLLQERIFKPIGMKSATLCPKQARSCADFSVSHEWHRTAIRVSETEEGDHDPLAPSGAVKASITDMSLFLATQLRQGISPQGRRVVSAKNLKETWKPHITDPDEETDYALGWVVEQNRNTTILSHEGSFDGFLALLTMIPEQQTGLVLLANMEDDDDAFLYDAYTDWLAHVL